MANNSTSTEYINLAAERLGAKALACSDDFFAEKDNLLKPGRGIFIDDKYTERGKWMDGWESRRSFGRDDGRDHDWAVIKLAYAGVLKAVDVDTHHFKGNAPLHISLEAAYAANPDSPDLAGIEWFELIAVADVQPDSQNKFDINDAGSYNLVRLSIFPDGGVARLKVYGEVVFEAKPGNELIDLACIANGGRAVQCSDMFFSDMNNMLQPDQSINMGDGWETKRRRDDGHDWNIVKLGSSGTIESVAVETQHYKGNFPNAFSLEAALTSEDEPDFESLTWQTIIPISAMSAHSKHSFEQRELAHDAKEIFSHVRINIFPDGGISRLRVYGRC